MVIPYTVMNSLFNTIFGIITCHFSPIIRVRGIDDTEPRGVLRDQNVQRHPSFAMSPPNNCLL